jgi:dolichyl-phosphate beta-glucosyltransferase
MQLHLDEILELSIVIPAYNESLRLPPFLESIRHYLDSSRWVPYEVIVVDDGSTDTTAATVNELCDSWPQLRLIMLPENQGKGAAVRRGVLASTSRLVLVSDADGSTPIDQLEPLSQIVERGADLVCGSRLVPQAQVGRNALRELVGRMFAALVRLLAHPPVSDTQCGFKLFRGTLSRGLFSLAREDRFSYDVEVLLLAELTGAAVSEVGVRWNEVAGSKVRIVRDGIRMFWDIVRIRRRVAALLSKVETKSGFPPQAGSIVSEVGASWMGIASDEGLDSIGGSSEVRQGGCVARFQAETNRVSFERVSSDTSAHQ